MAKKGDLLAVELEGRDDEGTVFDSTSGEIAKRLHGREGPMLISLESDKVIPGLHDALEGMEEGEEKEIEIPPEKAFGGRRKELVKIMSLAEFRKFNVAPEPGLVIHVDTERGRNYGTVKSVSGGRVMVDFNHPYAGKKVSYKIRLAKIHSTHEAKIGAMCENSGIVEKWDYRDGALSLSFREGSGQEFETAKALLLISLRARMPELKQLKVEKKEVKKKEEAGKKGG